MRQSFDIALIICTEKSHRLSGILDHLRHFEYMLQSKHK